MFASYGKVPRTIDDILKTDEKTLDFLCHCPTVAARSFLCVNRTKVKKAEFECDQCGKGFKYREAYNKHIKFVHPENGKQLSYKFTCSSCTEQFNHRRTYLSHLKTEHGIKVCFCILELRNLAGRKAFP